MAEKKVYCEKCKFLRWNIFYSHFCIHPENIEKHMVDTWKKRDYDPLALDHPKDINKNNDCKWFEEDTDEEMPQA